MFGGSVDVCRGGRGEPRQAGRRVHRRQHHAAEDAGGVRRRFIESSAGIGEVRTSNQGHSGHTTLDFLPADGKDAKGVKEAADAFVSPDRELVFSLMLGTNDSACKGPNGAPMSPATYQANLETITDRLLAAYPRAKVVLQYPVWYSTNTYNSSCYLRKVRRGCTPIGRRSPRWWRGNDAMRPGRSSKAASWGGTTLSATTRRR